MAPNSSSFNLNIFCAHLMVWIFTYILGLFVIFSQGFFGNEPFGWGMFFESQSACGLASALYCVSLTQLVIAPRDAAHSGNWNLINGCVVLILIMSLAAAMMCQLLYAAIPSFMQITADKIKTVNFVCGVIMFTTFPLELVTCLYLAFTRKEA